ncbi:ornithine carbamoyltransferase [Alteribacillus persepolensis]|uniref:Ornithine carbamoyltransferase n=1 Tax=Alteribacillus persepolensis TaxID=568899 RepID=A0A1G8H2S3_9BACI|nr:ornithine carbamoyltransferase [Alteribacillus persepolensis]SDI00906.1 ornithine carbamoyltransferase [Alteribacillus persepolensis]
MSEDKHIQPPGNLVGRDVLTLLDFTTDEIQDLLTFSEQLKEHHKQYGQSQLLQGKSLGMIFENASTRTRVSFEVGMTQLGGHSLFLSPRDMQIGRGEPIKDTAQVLSRYLDAIMIRTNSHETVEELATHSDVPVINALTDLYHPCQALADVLTIKEHKGSLDGLKAAFVGDGNNVANSLLVACAKTGMDAALAVPAGYEPDDKVWKEIQQTAEENGTNVELTNTPQDAVKDADVIYTDVWASMGYEEEQAKREKAFAGFQINEALCANAKDDFIFLHCLPAHRGEEVAASIIDGPHSAIYDEAENRLHVQKAILASVME